MKAAKDSTAWFVKQYSDCTVVEVKEGDLAEQNNESAWKTLGFVALKDQLRANAGKVIHYMQQVKRFTVVVCTGDAHGPALEIAGQLGIAPENVKSKMRPQDKVEVVENLRFKTSALENQKG